MTADGMLVGVNTAIIAPDDGNVGIGLRRKTSEGWQSLDLLVSHPPPWWRDGGLQRTGKECRTTEVPAQCFHGLKRGRRLRVHEALLTLLL